MYERTTMASTYFFLPKYLYFCSRQSWKGNMSEPRKAFSVIPNRLFGRTSSTTCFTDHHQKRIFESQLLGQVKFECQKRAEKAARLVLLLAYSIASRQKEPVVAGITSIWTPVNIAQYFHISRKISVLFLWEFFLSEVAVEEAEQGGVKAIAPASKSCPEGMALGDFDDRRPSEATVLGCQVDRFPSLRWAKREIRCRHQNHGLLSIFHIGRYIMHRKHGIF